MSPTARARAGFRGARRGVRPVRDPRRAHAGGDPRLAGGATAPADLYEFQCLHGIGQPLYEQVVGPVATASLARACRVLCAGRHPRDAARLPGPAPARERRRHLVRQSHRRRLGADHDGRGSVTTVERIADGEAGPGARIVGGPRPAIPLPREIYGAHDSIRAASTCRTTTRSRCWPRPCKRAAAQRGQRRRCSRRAIRPGRVTIAATHLTCRPRRSRRRRDASPFAIGRPRRHRRPRPRGDPRRRRWRRRGATALGAQAWATTAGRRARRDARARRRFARGRPAALARPARAARPARPIRRRHRGSARGGRASSFLRGAGTAPISLTATPHRSVWWCA